MKAPNLRAVLLTLLLVACASLPLLHYVTESEEATQQPCTTEAGRGELAVDLLIVGEHDASLVPLITPIFNRLSGGPSLPLLLVAPSERNAGADLFMHHLRPSRSIWLRTAATASPPNACGRGQGQVVELAPSPTRAAVQIARRFWTTAETVVIADADEPSAMILASALAVHVKAPIVPVGPVEDTGVVRTLLAHLQAKRVLLVTDTSTIAPAWTDPLSQQVQMISTEQACESVVRAIGPQQIRNVIVARAPNWEDETSNVASIAPYLSLARNAPVILCKSDDGRQTQAEVLAFIKSHSLNPQTITLLGDREDIGYIELRAPETLGDYTVEIEPCSGSIDGSAPAYGVGRIPYRRLSYASLLIARSLARERIVGSDKPRILMIANPSTDFGPLPFAETVARITSREFMNFGLSVDESYGKSIDDPQVYRAAARAHLLIFQGHVTDQLLFEEPLPTEEIPTTGDIADWDLGKGRGWFSAVEADGGRLAALTDEVEAARLTLTDTDASLDAEQVDDPASDVSEEIVTHPAVSRPDLDGQPLVFLQSCHSLDRYVADQVFTRGGVGLIGSVSNIHSASGSAFAKAFCDGLVYRGQTAGEALRDARTYFLCLARLKAQRGHTEQAKVYRVAMSFQLWGDPETTILAMKHAGAARLTPVSAKFITPHEVRITTPGKFLPKCRTKKYVARMFPGSQAAGIVKRLKGKEYRRLMPTYFFILPAPAGFGDENYTKLVGGDNETPQAVFITDPPRRNVYILYFPKQDKPLTEIILRFGR